MVRLVSVLATVVAAIAAMPAAPDFPEMPEPGHLALLLNDEEFEDYLDQWLEVERLKNANVSTTAPRNDGGCQLRVNGDLGQPQPVYLHNDNYPVPEGNTGVIHLKRGEPVTIACTGSGRSIVHPQITTTVATETAVCWNDLVFGSGWLSGNAEFLGLTCSINCAATAEYTTDRCYNDFLVIRVGFVVNSKFYTLFYSCFDPVRLEVLYVWYDQTPPNAVNQSGVARPGWLVGTGFFTGIPINSLYTQVQQKLKIASYVGDELADKYVTTQQYLARGHLCAKTDMIFATGQRATFYFINAAPQWQPFNAGNWNWLEQNLRRRIGEAGYHTKIWTGTWGVSELRNQQDELVEIYLDHDENNNPRLPVPMYYYKVVYEPTLKLGTAYVSINNPYYTEEEVRERQFCEDHCRGNADFSWLNWQADRIDIGYSFCCSVDDFRRTVPHLPEFEVVGILA